MTNATETMPFPPLSLGQRLRCVISLALVASMFVSILSRTVLHPADPEGSLSVWSMAWGWHGLLLTVGLAVVAALVGVWLSGGKLDELGVFGVCLGLILSSTWFANAGYLWMSLGQGNDEMRAQLARLLLLEVLGWGALLIATYLASLWFVRLARLSPLTPDTPSQEYRRGVLTVLFASLIAGGLVPILTQGTDISLASNTQAIFAWAMSFFIASLIAYQVTGARSSLWICIAAIVTAAWGCLWTHYHATPPYPGIAQFSPTAYGQALPIQMVFAAAGGGIFGNWQQRSFTRFAYLEDQNVSLSKAAQQSQ